VFEGVSDRQSDCECRRWIEGDADRGHQENQEQVSAVVLVELRRQGEFDTREQQQPTQYRIRYRFEQRIAALAEAKPEHDKHEADQNGRGRCVLDMLRRADSPMMAREIAAELAARYQIDASNMDAMNALVAKVRNTLARQRGLASEMRGDAKAWRVEA
jgi:hypothetical protein